MNSENRILNEYLFFPWDVLCEKNVIIMLFSTNHDWEKKIDINTTTFIFHFLFLSYYCDDCLDLRIDEADWPSF